MTEKTFGIGVSNGSNEVPLTLGERIIFRRADRTEIEIREVNGTIQISAIALRGASHLRIIPQASNIIRVAVEFACGCDNIQEY